MGWLFTHGASRADVIHEITATQRVRGRTWRTIEHTLVRDADVDVLWAVHESVIDGDAALVFIGCHLLDQRDGAWGYKSMDESMGPCFYSCPLSMLDLAPVACESWRARVREEAR